MNLQGRKILICEEALIDETGHFQTWIKAIREMHLAANAEVLIAGSQWVSQNVRDDLNVLPIYSHNSWDQSVSKQWPSWRRQLLVFVHNWRVFAETRQALLRSGPVDIILFTAVRVHHVIGLRLLCWLGLGVHFKRMVFFLLISQATYNSTFTSFYFSARTRLLALVLGSFRRLAGTGMVILAGDSHITCNEYEKLAGIPMTLFPSPGATFSFSTTKRPSTQPVFSILGVSTWDKGVDVFQAAIIDFFARNPSSSVSFVLQWSVDCQAPDGSIVPISDQLRGDSRVRFIEHRLSNDEYAEIFNMTDFIVLPYRRATYFNRISGVAVESALSGKPMIVTENTWLSWAMKRFGSGLSIPEDDFVALALAIEKCCSEWSNFKAEGQCRMSEAKSYNSPKRYMSLMWGNLQ